MCPEEPTNPLYDESIAQRAIMYANAAYGREEDGGAVLPKGFQQGIAYNYSVPHDPTTGFMFIGVDTQFKQLIISFRGTTSAKQLMDDMLDLQLVPFVSQNPKLLGGMYFVRLVNGLYPMYTPKFIEYLQQYPDYDVLVCGHSLGAAMATINNMKLAHDTNINPLLYGRNLYSYTVGEPRAGNIELADTVNSLWPNSFRIVADLDPIPHLPECVMGKGKEVDWLCYPDEAEYWHHFQEVWYPIGEYTKVEEDPTGIYGHENPVTPCGSRQCIGEKYHGEDWSCSDQFPFSFDIEHHFQYWGTLAYGFCNTGWGFETFVSTQVWDEVIQSS